MDALRDSSLRPAALLAAYAEGWFPMDAPGADGAVSVYAMDGSLVVRIAGTGQSPSFWRENRLYGELGFAARARISARHALRSACVRRMLWQMAT